MTQDEVIEMAMQAGFMRPNPHDGYMGLAYDRRDANETGASLKAFAKLVADVATAKEREEWRNAAIRVGENLATCGPAGYYDFTAQQWLDWALDATTKMQDDYMNLGACGEREACAKLVDYWEAREGEHADAIRARGEA